METMETKDVRKNVVWETPTLTFQGTVGDILKAGGGKESLQLADSGEMRCEKPHVDKCNPF